MEVGNSKLENKRVIRLKILSYNAATMSKVVTFFQSNNLKEKSLKGFDNLWIYFVKDHYISILE